MASPASVLVTGSAGRIGQAVIKELGAEARGFDLVPTPNAADSIVGRIQDTAALSQAMPGVRTVIHLAATPDDDDFMTKLLPDNIVGLYNVFESARQAGVKRLVLASSQQVVWYERQRGPWPIRVETSLTPRHWYACTKVFLEAAGRAFHEAHGLSVIVARVGWCPRTKEQVEEISRTPWAQNGYFSPGDAGRFFARAPTPPTASASRSSTPVASPSPNPSATSNPPAAYSATSRRKNGRRASRSSPASHPTRLDSSAEGPL